MYYVWQQRLCLGLCCSDGTPIEVLHPGLRNLDAGPDFFNSKVRIGGKVWAGNVEMHCRASDWFRHGHDNDRAYDSVILHVVLVNDAEVRLHDGTVVPVAVMKIPDKVLTGYQELCSGLASPLLPGQAPVYSSISCTRHLASVPKVIITDWLTALCSQRMMGKMQRVSDLVEGQHKAWQEAFYIMLMRSLGTSVNSDAMERLARSLPYNALLHHRDNLLQLQALLLGQAGLLSAQDAASKPAADQNEWKLMQREYAFLRQKFSLSPLPVLVWKMGRIRPPAQPEARLRAMALLLHRHADLLSDVLDASDIDQTMRVLAVKGLGKQTLRSLIINAVVPTMLCYAHWQGDDTRSELALHLLEQLPAEDNRYIRQWADAGIKATSAFESQALLQLFTQYCQPHKCLRCRIGCRLLSTLHKTQ